MTVLPREIIYFSATSNQVNDNEIISIFVKSGNISLNLATSEAIILPAEYNSEKVLKLQEEKYYSIDLSSEVNSFGGKSSSEVKICKR